MTSAAQQALRRTMEVGEGPGEAATEGGMRGKRRVAPALRRVPDFLVSLKNTFPLALPPSLHPSVPSSPRSTRIRPALLWPATPVARSSSPSSHAAPYSASPAWPTRCVLSPMLTLPSSLCIFQDSLSACQSSQVQRTYLAWEAGRLPSLPLIACFPCLPLSFYRTGNPGSPPPDM